jgi:hypothetical protein
MAERIRKFDSSEKSIPPILPRKDATWAPASLGQQRLWLLDQMNPGSPAYNVGVLVRLNGKLNLDALQGSLAAMMDRHETLRARFEVARGQVCQIFDVPPIFIEREEPANEISRDFETLYRAAYKEAAKPFDLRTGPVLRAKLYQSSATETYLLLTIHQTIVDGWSLKLLFQELAAYYTHLASGRAIALTPLSIQYGDFSAWQREWLQGEVLEKQMDYWRKELAGELPEIDLPTDLPRPQIQTFIGDTQVQHLPADLSDDLRGYAKDQGTTAFMAIIAAYQMFLSRISGQDEVIIGTAMAGRNRSELENLLGFFVNTVALRASFLPNPSFSKLLGQIREKTLAAYQHQYAPFEKIVEELQPVRGGSKRPPIFQVWFGAWDALPEHRVGDLCINPVKVFMPGAQFELSLFAIDRKEIELIWEYRTDLFLAGTITRLRAQFENLLRRVLRSPDTPLQTIFAAMNEEEYHERLREQTRLREGLRSAKRKRLEPVAPGQNPS